MSIFICLKENGEIDLKLLYENEKELVSIRISYLIIVVLKNESYSKDMSGKVFNSLSSMYIKNINDLLREANYLPLPLNVEC